MKRWQVTVKEYTYHGIYADADTAEEAENIVKKMLDDGKYTYDCTGYSGVKVLETFLIDADDEYTECDNCEENWNCPDVTRLDGCMCGIKKEENV